MKRVCCSLVVGFICLSSVVYGQSEIVVSEELFKRCQKSENPIWEHYDCHFTPPFGEMIPSDWKWKHTKLIRGMKDDEGKLVHRVYNYTDLICIDFDASPQT